MKYIRGFFAFWYDFIIGDAWEVAAGVVLSLILLYAGLQYFGPGAIVYATILLPLAIAVLVTFSIWRVRSSG
jgi:hypothetical protein